MRGRGGRWEVDDDVAGGEEGGAGASSLSPVCQTLNINF